ncbi:hypothetical protein F3J22_22225 [Chitinophaga sp. Cy-1792]|nr:hypothetical protein [Chitinophaga sp. Cy-1792]
MVTWLSSNGRISRIPVSIRSMNWNQFSWQELF